MTTNVQIKDQIMIVLLLYAIMEAHDVRVLQLSTDPSLSFQLLKVCKSNREFGSLYLDITNDVFREGRTGALEHRLFTYLGTSISLC